jgi:hypothetical protein
MPPVRRLAAILAADVAGYSRLMGVISRGIDGKQQSASISTAPGGSEIDSPAAAAYLPRSLPF